MTSLLENEHRGTKIKLTENIIIVNMSEKRLNILEGIEKGISQSYLGAFNKIYGIDNSIVPGVAIPQWELNVVQPYDGSDGLTAQTITVDAGTDEIISTNPINNYYIRGTSVRFTTTGTLPAGLAVNTTYYVHRESTYRIKVATSIYNLGAGTYVNITDTGTGTHTMTPEIMQDARQIIDIGGDRYFAITGDDMIWYNNSTTNGGRQWMRITGHAAGSFYGLAFWKNYLLCFHNDDIDILGPISGNELNGASWDNGRLSFEADSLIAKPSLIMSNDVLYIGDGKYVASLTETVGDTFDPTDVASFTWSNQALDLPANETIKSLEQLGSNLMIGTLGADGIGRIYSWDTISPSFEEPIKTGLKEVSTTIVVDNVLYFFDRYFGDIYATNGVSVQKVKDFYKSAINTQQYYYAYPIEMQTYGNSIIAFGDKILFGIGGQTIRGAGVWSYNTKTQALVLEYPLNSQIETSTTSYVYAMCKRSSIDFWVSCWDGGKSGNYRYTMQSINFVTNQSDDYNKIATSYFETGLMTVGDKYQPATFRFFEIQCGKELASREVITLYYRNNLTDSWTTIGTMSYANDGAIASKIIENSSVSGDQIQFKVTISVASNARSAPEIKAIYIY
jgi:hypothetical protein